MLLYSTLLVKLHTSHYHNTVLGSSEPSEFALPLRNLISRQRPSSHRSHSKSSCQYVRAHRFHGKWHPPTSLAQWSQFPGSITGRHRSQFRFLAIVWLHPPMILKPSRQADGALMSPLSHNGRGVHHTLPAEAVFRRQIPRDAGVTRYPGVPTGTAILPIN